MGVLFYWIFRPASYLKVRRSAFYSHIIWNLAYYWTEVHSYFHWCAEFSPFGVRGCGSHQICSSFYFMYNLVLQNLRTCGFSFWIKYAWSETPKVNMLEFAVSSAATAVILLFFCAPWQLSFSGYAAYWNGKWIGCVRIWWLMPPLLGVGDEWNRK